MTGFAQNATDKNLRAWLSAGPVDRMIGDGLSFVASEAGARDGKASWILRYRFAGRQREKVLGRYPDISLKEARELARSNRAQVQQGVDVGAQKRLDKLKALQMEDVRGLGQRWYERFILNRIKNPQVVERVLRLHVYPVIGKLAIHEVRPHHIDGVLTKIVEAGAPTVANDAMRYLFRMFHFAAKRKWTEANPVAGFDISDAGGTETPRDRWLSYEDLTTLAQDMRETVNFGRANELAVWLLLALCVRKMELLSAKCADFDLQRGLWKLQPNRTKTKSYIEIPLAPQVVAWLEEAIVFACGSEYLFPARRLIKMKNGQPRTNRFGHISPDTLNVALTRLPLEGIEHFTVHDMRRTARTQLGALGVDPFVAERALNHKLRGTQRIYDQHDYFPQRRHALSLWAEMLGTISRGEPVDFSATPKREGSDPGGIVTHQPGRLPNALVARRAANE
nr:site-specific integrase [uncultured Roseateles sp.]